MKRTNDKKVLIITGLTEKSFHLFPAITNKEADQLLITSNFGTIISQPYGCTVRNIILAVHLENVEEVYIIGEKNSKEHSLNGEEILSKIRESGISRETIETIEYIDAVGNNLSDWLVGNQDVKEVINENILLLKNHPLIPKTLSIYGFIASSDTGEFEVIA